MTLDGPQFFAARRRGAVWWITLIGSALLLAVLVGGVLYFRQGLFWAWTMLLTPTAVLLVCWLLSVRGYLVDQGVVYVLRPFGRLRIARRIREASADDRAFDGAWRLWANGGLFALVGWFGSRRLGTFRAWVTDLSCLVVLRHEDDVAVVSPAERERFIAALHGAQS